MPPARKLPKPLRRPDYFPAEQVYVRTLPAALATQREWEACRFQGIDFGAYQLAGWRFTDCRFENCNLTGANLLNTALQNADFVGCKLLGLAFQQCRDLLFGVHFEHCQLDYATFSNRAMPQTRFVSCSLLEVDFTQADLTHAVFEDCQLSRAIFQHTKLAGADFSTAHDIQLDPAQNEVAGARFRLDSLPGLLSQFNLAVV